MKKLITILFLFTLLYNHVFSQDTITTTAATVTACPGDTLVIPVYTTGCIDAGSISLTLEYDTAVLEYETLILMPAVDTNGLSVFNNVGTQVRFSYFSMLGTDIIAGVLLECVFIYKGGTSSLHWSQLPGDCQYANINFIDIPALYIDGSVDPVPGSTISGQPSDVTVYTGLPATFSISAQSVYSYQWEVNRNDGNGFVNCIDGGVFSGSLTQSLTLTNTTMLMNGWQFRCKVNGSCGMIYSDIAILNVTNNLPTITTTIGSATACPGDTIAVPVSVLNFIDVASLSHEIRFDTSVLIYSGYQNVNPVFQTNFFANGTTGGQFSASWFDSVNSVALPDGILYELIFVTKTGNAAIEWDHSLPGNNIYSDISSAYFSTIWKDGYIESGNPIIIYQTADTVVNENMPAILTVVASHATTYQWEESIDNGLTWQILADTGIYSGCTTSNLYISSVSVGMNAYMYRCNISNICNFSVYTNPIVITTTPTIFIYAASKTACAGDTLSVPIIVSGCNDISAITLTMNYDPSVLVYQGYRNINPELSPGNLLMFSTGDKIKFSWISPLQGADPVGLLVEFVFISNGGYSPLTWDTAMGNCQFSDIAFNVIPSIFINGSIDTGAGSMIVSQPSNTSAYVGTPASFSVTAQGLLNGLAPFHWAVDRKDGYGFVNCIDDSVFSGSLTSNLIIAAVTAPMDGWLFHCLVSGNCGMVYTDSVELTVDTTFPAIVTYIDSIYACQGDSIEVPVNVVDFYNVASLSLVMNYDSNKVVFGGFHYITSGMVDTALAVDVVDLTNNPVLNKQIRISWSGLTLLNLGTELLLKLVFYYNGGSADFAWSTIPGETQYSDQYSNILPASFIDGKISDNNSPIITSQPDDITIYENDNAGFTLDALTASSYQWEESADNGISWNILTDNSIYSGTNTNTLDINNVTLVMDGYWYRCEVSNSCSPSVYSDIVVLNVNHAISLITTTVGSVPANIGDTIAVPVYVTDCYNIGAITLTLGYDTTVLEYKGHQNAHPAFNTGVMLMHQVGSSIRFAFFSFQKVDIGTDLFIEYLFVYKGGTSDLVWDTLTAGECSYNNPYWGEIPSLFFNGTVPDSILTTQPSSKSVTSGTPVSFNVGSLLKTFFQWQVNRNDGNAFVNCIDGGIYSGSQSTTLNLSSTDLTMDGWRFRCLVSGSFGTIISNSASLGVTDAAGGIITSLDSIQACVGDQVIIPVNVKDCDDVAAISLKFGYDTAVLTYQGYQNAHPDLSVGTMTANATGGYTSFAWFSFTQSVNIGNGLLLEFIFSLNGGNCDLNWDTITPGSCEYIDFGGNVLLDSYINGYVEDISPIADAGPDQTIAYGTHTILNGSVTGGSGTYTYSWTPATLLVDPTVEDPTTILYITNTVFKFTATDINTGCVSLTDSTTVYVMGPGLQTNPTAIPDTICPGDTSFLFANPSFGSGVYTFSWISDPPGFNSTQENPNVTPIENTWYIVTVNDGFTTFTDSVLVTVVPIANAGQDAAICEDDSYQLQGSAVGYSSVLWTTSGNGIFNDNTLLKPNYTPGINDIANGKVILTLTVTAAPPCIGTVSSSMTLTINPLPTADAGNNATICDYESYTLNGSATSQSSVLWNTSGDGTFNDATILNASYTPGPNDIATGAVVLTFTANPLPTCTTPATSTMTLTIIQSPVVDLGQDTTICYYNTIALHAGNPGSTYLWSTGETTEYIIASSPTPNTTTHYYVTVTQNNGCTGMDDIYVTFDDCVSLEENQNRTELTIIPNPSSGKFKIQISKSKNIFYNDNIEMQIVNIQGKIISSEILFIDQQKFEKEVNMENFPKGIYFVRFRGENFIRTEKLVIK